MLDLRGWGPLLRGPSTPDKDQVFMRGAVLTTKWCALLVREELRVGGADASPSPRVTPPHHHHSTLQDGLRRRRPGGKAAPIPDHRKSDRAEAADAALVVSKLSSYLQIESKKEFNHAEFLCSGACHGKAACVSGHLTAKLPAPWRERILWKTRSGEVTSGDVCVEDICPWTWVWGL